MKLMLRELREDRGLTVSQMVARLGVKDSRYRKWESQAAAIPLEYAMACCSVLHCSLDELSGRVRPSLDADEVALVELCRRCSPKGREILLQAAESAAGLFPA